MTCRIIPAASLFLAAAIVTLPPAPIDAAEPKLESPRITYHTAKIDGVDIFYREAGPKDAPAILLLHAYPSSSFMFRNLIPLLMDKYHVVAPDFPGYGQSSAPPADKYAYTFGEFSEVAGKLAETLGLNAYAIYCGPDVGSYVGFRLAAKHPERVTALVIQNGEAYAESRNKEFWRPFEAYGKDRSEANAKHLHKHLSIEDNRWHYTHGARNV
jgi:pimeloyl-ACP methyl ester carboxylesterase